MTCVDRIKAILKERGIPVSKLEKDLGFSNGYIGQIKKGTIRADRLALIAAYLDVTTEYLNAGITEHRPVTVGPGAAEALEELRESERALLQVTKGMTEDQVKAMTEFAKMLKGRNNAD